jgi:hypothetical protein
MTTSGVIGLGQTYFPPNLRMSLSNSMVAVGDNLTVHVAMNGQGPPAYGGGPVAGQVVTIYVAEGAFCYLFNCFPIGPSIENLTTDSSGEAELTFGIDQTPGPYTVVAAYSGNESGWGGTTNSSLLAVVNSTTSVTESVPSSIMEGSNSTLGATLLDNKGSPLAGATIGFLANDSLTGEAVTDAAGRAEISYLPSSAGVVKVRAEFGGEGTLYGSSSSPVAMMNVISSVRPSSPSGGFPTLDLLGVVVVVVVLGLVGIAAWIRRNRR